MGFDISPSTREENHWVEGFYYGVWANELSCFDIGEGPDSEYYYLAGDSFSWGFAPFQSKYGTIVEKRTDMRVLKCGVPHTGQLHQLMKARKVISRIGRSPKAIIVQYFPNDVCNDFAFPHSTVVDGWLFENKSVVQAGDTWSIQIRTIGQWSGPARATTADNVRFQLRKYSLTANVVIRAYYRLRSALWGRPANRTQGIYPSGVCDGSTPPSYQGPLYERNREGLYAFKAYADSIGSDLVFVLVPPLSNIGNVAYFESLKNMLEGEGIDYVDLSGPFAEYKGATEPLYWYDDMHLSIAGNALAAHEIVAHLQAGLSAYGAGRTIANVAAPRAN